MPFFTVVIPTYNRAHIVERAIKSVLSQTFTDYEILIVDDGSIDGTVKVIESFSNDKINYIYQENKGVCSARNLGAKYSKGKYLVFLDSDDYVLENWLTDFHKILNEGDGADLVFCDLKIVDIKTKQEKFKKAQYPFGEHFQSNYGLYLSGVFCVDRDFFLKLGGFDEKLKFGEFAEFGMRCFLNNPTKKYTCTTGFIYEISMEGGGKNWMNRIDSNLYIIEKHRWFFDKYSHSLRLYYQNIAVAYAKLSDMKQAKKYFWKAFVIKPTKIKTLTKCVMCFFPKLAKTRWN
ncbi:MAG: glycosyltransferase family 2 protein [Flavobacterium sp.]